MQAPDEIETGSDAEAGSRLGEENEVLRNLLSETERKLIEFDDLKVTFAALLEPAGRALRTLEQEKTRNLGLQRSLNRLRTTTTPSSPGSSIWRRVPRSSKTKIRGCNETW